MSVPFVQAPIAGAASFRLLHRPHRGREGDLREPMAHDDALPTVDAPARPILRDPPRDRMRSIGNILFQLEE
jgi:hypothetical protein